MVRNVNSQAPGEGQDDDDRLATGHDSLQRVTRDFCRSMQKAAGSGSGGEPYAEILYHASYKSARHWCEKEARTLGLSGMAVFEHYLHRLSRRGWGRFSVVEADATNGFADVRLDHSTFVLAQAEACATKTCYMFAGWFAGMMDWIAENAGQPVKTICCETQCGADGFDHCIFAIRPQLFT